MREIDVITLEDGKEYILLKEKLINNVKYFLLVNGNDKDDFVIRKQSEYEIIGLDDEEEFEKVVGLFMESN